MKRTGQGSFEFKSWGGARKGAGRKRAGLRRNMPHRARGELSKRHPAHVTLRLVGGLESLRTGRNFAAVRAALASGSDRLGMRLVHFSVMTNHLHLVCEAEDQRALSRGIKGLSVRIARALNRLWARGGRVFADRFHSHALKSPREVRHALAYVLNNAAHHAIRVAHPDPCSSGAWFEGWTRNPEHARARLESPFQRARTWLLCAGWRRHGPIEPAHGG